MYFSVWAMSQDEAPPSVEPEWVRNLVEKLIWGMWLPMWAERTHPIGVHNATQPHRHAPISRLPTFRTCLPLLVMKQTQRRRLYHWLTLSFFRLVPYFSFPSSCDFRQQSWQHPAEEFKGGCYAGRFRMQRGMKGAREARAIIL